MLFEDIIAIARQEGISNPAVIRDRLQARGMPAERAEEILVMEGLIEEPNLRSQAGGTTHTPSRSIGGAGWPSTRDDLRPFTDVTVLQEQLQKRHT
jgi:hypothetical protein